MYDDDEQIENTIPYDDDTHMPFGKHKGTRLADIEPSYFHWLWFKCKYNSKTSHDKLSQYINKNIKRFKSLDEDLIWD